jgi:hypothetical protein
VDLEVFPFLPMIFPIAQKYQPFIRFTCFIEFDQQITAFSMHKSFAKASFYNQMRIKRILPFLGFDSLQRILHLKTDLT